MSEDLSEACLANISFMQRAAKTAPDDFMMVAAVQALAQTVADLKPLLTPAQEALLLGCGALMINAGRNEAIAGIQAAVALNKARRQ